MHEDSTIARLRIAYIPWFLAFREYIFSDGQVDFERLKELAHAVGRQRLVLDLSCRKKVNNLPKDVAFVTRTKAAWIVFYFVSV
ncbi:UNVERIFIED_CONTAM: 1-(5-phosphoribosyl)-5-[(5-phosphoribosylamino)methylideneamino] imidazole-4-carboxamide isomerase [Sesamum radiatum]|uniref:1-(5-phosphoribosyl)-5-[(5-phosphoribosylamino)methylideneamino] imidazole-4-carboxamide isomerase n=1 Tax=Sesamum radiatum TaxID=300843 RepID=A0AAW2KRD1_SESRA